MGACTNDWPMFSSVTLNGSNGWKDRAIASFGSQIVKWQAIYMAVSRPFKKPSSSMEEGWVVVRTLRSTLWRELASTPFHGP